MKVILFSAISINGMIADKDGKEDFLSDSHWRRVVSLIEEAGAVVMGGGTYRTLEHWENNFDDLDGVEKVVVTQEGVKEGYVSRENPRETIEFLEEKGYEKLVLVGGSKLTSSFLDEDLVDEIVLSIEPVIIPYGIPVCLIEKEIELDKKKVEKRDDGIVEITYKVV
jgi:dihydrofolate reductase